ncbi:MAG: transposase [Candidatus Zixiibacteriota bacterium]
MTNKTKESPAVRRRRSVRLREYDYSQSGAYFVTICTQDRRCLFGEIVDGTMRLNDTGRIVEDEWLHTPTLRPQVAPDTFVVMPNHFHAIVFITDRRGVLQYAPTPRLASPSQTIGAIVRGFKGATTKRINAFRGTPGQPVWQRNYYEHVIRNDDDLHATREYVLNNRLAWALDRENPTLTCP